MPQVGFGEPIVKKFLDKISERVILYQGEIMAYKHNWNPSTKATKKELREALMQIATELTDTQFTVTFQSDDGGHHAVIVAEREEGSEESPFKNLDALPRGFMGWRIIKLHVPAGYISVFYNEDGTKSVTKTRDD